MAKHLPTARLRNGFCAMVTMLNLAAIFVSPTSVNAADNREAFTSDQLNVTLSPPDEVSMMVGKTAELIVECRHNDNLFLNSLNFSCNVAPPQKFARVKSIREITTDKDVDLRRFVCELYGLRIEICNLTLNITTAGVNTITSENDFDAVVWQLSPNSTYRVVVTAYSSALNKIAQFGFLIALSMNAAAYGLKLEWEEVADFARHPIGTIISFCSQYIFMPSLAYGFGLMLKLPAHLRMGMLCVSCVPGGLPSNVMTLLLRGDMNLSIVMTTFSNVAALAMTPLWLYTLGQHIIRSEYPDAEIEVPWVIFVLLIIMFTIPLFIGIFIGVRFPVKARIVCTVVRSIALTICFAMVVLLITAYHWLTDYMDDWRVVMAGFILPYTSFTISYLFALMFRRSKRVAFTIMIETGIQNLAIAVMLMEFCIPVPYNDAAIVIIGVIVVSTYMPFIAICILSVLYGVYERRRAKETIRRNNSVSFVSSIKVNDPGVGGGVEGMSRAGSEIEFSRSNSRAVLVVD